MHAPASAPLPIVAIGASTGGPQALATVLKSLPRPVPWPVVIVQHIDPGFAPGLASWLAEETRQPVEIVTLGEPPRPGRIVVAATGDHILLDGDGRLRYAADPRDIVYRPSVDVFFDSLAADLAAPGVAVILTGMGRDGAAGLGRLRSTGWHTIAQDKATSIVWGMPGAAAESGAAVEVLPVDAIGAAITANMAHRPANFRRLP